MAAPASTLTAKSELLPPPGSHSWWTARLPVEPDSQLHVLAVVASAQLVV